jgi:hypothetical protein
MIVAQETLSDARNTQPQAGIINAHYLSIMREIVPLYPIADSYQGAHAHIACLDFTSAGKNGNGTPVPDERSMSQTH